MVHGDVFAASHLGDSFVYPEYRPSIFLITECLDASIRIALDDRPGIIRGSVIPNDQLEIGEGLIENAINRFPDVFPVIERCQYYRNLRHMHFFSIPHLSTQP